MAKEYKWRNRRGIWSIGDESRLEISIHHMVYDEEHWYLSCHRVEISRRQLDSSDLEDAKIEAVKIIESKLKTQYKELQKLKRFMKDINKEG
jgi:predicted transcriptional regulator